MCQHKAQVREALAVGPLFLGVKRSNNENSNNCTDVAVMTNYEANTH